MRSRRLGSRHHWRHRSRRSHSATFTGTTKPGCVSMSILTGPSAWVGHPVGHQLHYRAGFHRFSRCNRYFRARYGGHCVGTTKLGVVPSSVAPDTTQIGVSSSGVAMAITDPAGGDPSIATGYTAPGLDASLRNFPLSTMSEEWGSMDQPGVAGEERKRYLQTKEMVAISSSRMGAGGHRRFHLLWYRGAKRGWYQPGRRRAGYRIGAGQRTVGYIHGVESYHLCYRSEVV